MRQTRAYTLSELAKRLSSTIAADEYLQNVWITAETMDVRVSGGHCYLELIEKNPQTGQALAKAKATIWASLYHPMAAKFLQETGQQFRSDLKVMVCVSANYHVVYGLSLNILAINSAYTLGDAMQRRREMIERLTREGIINMNRTLEWTVVPQRIAVISARGAAGYGDFMHQLYSNQYHLRFTTQLFSANLQGDRTAPSIIAALESIAVNIDEWDCVVIIRGGGATSDLAAFDHYDLAAHIAQFPLPVIIGIGHERDVTLLDYVANMRVKTPTAAAEWLISKGEQALGRLQGLAAAMLQAVSDRMNGCQRQLAYIAGQLPSAALNVVRSSRNRLTKAQVSLGAVSERIRPEFMRLDNMRQQLEIVSKSVITNAYKKIDNYDQLLKALSPEATLRRGYSITRVGGHAVSTVAGIQPGEVLETILSDGSIFSVATAKETDISDKPN